jgi:hypothetical protein
MYLLDFILFDYKGGIHILVGWGLEIPLIYGVTVLEYLWAHQMKYQVPQLAQLVAPHGLK